MTRNRSPLVALATFAWLAAVPQIVQAQSVITGVVKDDSGGVLPGVNVEAASDVLIEKVRGATTDGSGQYRIIDLRPGIYTITFSLQGFQTIRRDKVELPSEFTMTLNADLKVGSISETITVSGAAPVVDVQSATRVQVMDRESLDNIPTGRTIQGVGQLIVGVNLSLPDVGGSRAAMQTYMSVHGQSAAQNTVMVDGMVVNGLEANGAVQNYFNDAASQEISYQTAGNSAERSGGGVSLNLIPREGGNRFSGGTTLSHRPGEWQGDNLTPRLQQAGLQVGNSTEYIFDGTLSEGGPIMRDKLWFFVSGREYRTSNRVSNTFFDDGRQGVDYNYIRQGLIRLTYQLSQGNKLSAYYDRVDKYRSHDMQSNEDPETASQEWLAPNYSTGAIKYTSTMTSRILLEAGYSQNVEYRNTFAQPGIGRVRGAAEWFGNATKTITPAGLGLRTTAPSTYGSQFPLRKNAQASLSYVTGAHHFKTGMQWQWGKFWHYTDANADLSQLYSQYTRVGNEVVFSNPFGTGDLSRYRVGSVSIRNTPTQSQESLSADLGIFVQDQWTFKRMTVNAGLRYEYLNSQVDEWTAPAGRFVPERTQPLLDNLPNWKDFAPRFQIVYDLFGDAKTAVKFSLNRYNSAQAVSLAAGFNGLGSTTSTRTWVDLNGDDIAQGQRTWNPDGTYTDCIFLTAGCEINLSGSATQGALSPRFGLLDEADQYSGYPRTYSIERGLEVQHALFPRLSITGGWYHTEYSDLTKTVNLNRRSWDQDYVKMTVYNPVTGAPFTYYNSTAAYQSRATNNVTFNEPLRESHYDQYTAEWRWRPGPGAQIFGGFAWERSLGRDCLSSQPNAFVDPNSIAFCDEFDPSRETPNGIETYDRKPYNLDFRLGISYPLPWWGVTFGASYLDNDEGSTTMSYLLTRTTRYPDGTPAGGFIAPDVPAPPCPSPCPAGQLTSPTLVASAAGVDAGSLIVPGTNDAERLRQLDLKFSKTFRYRGVSIAPTFEIFNTFNSDMVITYGSTSYANLAGTYLVPNSIVQGRIIGWGANVRW
jgi:hypothetical protein